jgi:hypothetical protein
MPGPDSLLERDGTLKKRFLGLIKDGVPRKYACLGCGFSYRTLYGWVRQGLAEHAREPYRAFALDLYKTEVELMRKWLKRLGTAAPKGERDNMALAWLLSHRFPKAFGRLAEVQADPAEDIERELDQAEDSAGQLEAGGDGGQLDPERWSIVRAWFESRDPKLLELALETGLAQAAVEASGGTKT